jgi:branched-chain amino acid aminotransferase
MQFAIFPTTAPTQREDISASIASPVFGRVLTDYMATIRWTHSLGWHDARVEQRRPFQIDPACAVLHYAQEIFEGLKAYRGGDGSITLLRPFENASRFRASAARMSMPELPEALFVGAVEALVKIDRDWVPGGEGSLYLRPFMFASESFLGVRASNKYIFCVIASPVGPYFKLGKTTISIWISDRYTRAASGGTGAAKCGGNYAASLIAQTEAAAQECDQVMFLDASEHKWIEEMGGMNVFFVMEDGSLLTPPLSGTILPGITRASIIDLAREEGIAVTEQPYAFETWQADVLNGHVKEAFACGTAADVIAIGKVRHAAGEFEICDGGEGPVTRWAHSALTGIRRGKIADRFGWRHCIM